MPRLIFNFLISAVEISVCLSLLIKLVFEGLHLVFILFSPIFESTYFIFGLRYWDSFLTNRAWIKLLLWT
jgi:hypothetical protein